MKIFMKVVLVVAVVAIIAGVVGGVITTNDRRNEQELLRLEREEMREQYQNGDIDRNDFEDREALRNEKCEQYKNGDNDKMEKGGRDRMGKDGYGARGGMKGDRDFYTDDSEAESEE